MGGPPRRFLLATFCWTAGAAAAVTGRPRLPPMRTRRAVAAGSSVGGPLLVPFARASSVQAEPRGLVAGDPHNIVERFVRTHAEHFAGALQEIKSGRKRSHWSWFIFPTPPYTDAAGVERGSRLNSYYALRGDDAARSFLSFPADNEFNVDLRRNVIDIFTAVAQQLEAGTDPTTLVGSLDVPKLCSSLALFRRIAAEDGDDELEGVCARCQRAIYDPPERPRSSNGWKRFLS
jgi:uncharacterized protein (DUF1810 family)